MTTQKYIREQDQNGIIYYTKQENYIHRQNNLPDTNLKITQYTDVIIDTNNNTILKCRFNLTDIFDDLLLIDEKFK